MTCWKDPCRVLTGSVFLCHPTVSTRGGSSADEGRALQTEPSFPDYIRLCPVHSPEWDARKCSLINQTFITTSGINKTINLLLDTRVAARSH